MPTTAPKARVLLNQGRARVFRLYPFTIQLNYESQHSTQPVEIRIDYGAKMHGIALVQQCKTHDRVIFLGEARQRHDVKKKMSIRKELRRLRRYRNTRHRKRRFHRRRPKGSLPPTISQRIETITRVAKTLRKMTPITSAIAETGAFDTQKMIHPEIKSSEYQRGPVFGFQNKKQATLAYFDYTCQYCGTKKGVMTIDHVIPRGKGGADAWSNLTCACLACNNKKGDRTPEEAGMRNPKTINPRSMNFLKFCALAQSGKTKLVEELQKLVPTQTVYGWQTKQNRELTRLPKTHYFDALCTRDLTQRPIQLTSAIYEIKLMRRNIRKTHHSNPQEGGERQRYNSNKSLKLESQCFRKGDLIKTVRGSGYIDSIKSSGRLIYRTILGNRQDITPERLRLLESVKRVSFYQMVRKFVELH